ncbi:MAG: hypothetical protein OSB19_04120 [Opitutaceae bacterium]|nr:hypothetical protein [Opitutaceae bacterium]
MKQHSCKHCLILQVCLTIVLLSPHTLSATDIVIDVGTLAITQSGPLLVGANVVYSHEDIRTWQDGEKIQALIDSGINNLRYPGGHLVSFWDWEFPYHNAYANFWDPSYIDQLTEEKKEELQTEHANRMGLEGFLNICKITGAEPLIGINMFQGYRNGRKQDSIDKAVRLVEWCQKQDPKPRFYYLDNEAGHQPTQNKHIPIEDYIPLIPDYSKAIKQADPEAKIIANLIQWNPVKTLIEEVGDHVDIYEHHWYYYNRVWGEFHLEDWRNEFSISEQDNRINQFNNWKNQYDKPHLQFAYLEWNIGPAREVTGATTGTPFYQGLVQADVLMYMIRNNVYMASIWPLTWKSNNPDPEVTGGFRSLIDPDTGHVTSSGAIFKAFSLAAEGRIIPLDMSTPNRVRGLAVQANFKDRLLVYLLNKTDQSITTELNIGRMPLKASYMTYTQGDPSYHGQVEEHPIESIGPSLKITLPDTSFVFVRLDFEEAKDISIGPLTIERLQSEVYRLSLESAHRGYQYELLEADELDQQDSWRGLQSRIPVFSETGEPLHFDLELLGEQSFFKIRKIAIE